MIKKVQIQNKINKEEALDIIGLSKESLSDISNVLRGLSNGSSFTGDVVLIKVEALGEWSKENFSEQRANLKAKNLNPNYLEALKTALQSFKPEISEWAREDKSWTEPINALLGKIKDFESESKGYYYTVCYKDDKEYDLILKHEHGDTLLTVYDDSFLNSKLNELYENVKSLLKVGELAVLEYIESSLIAILHLTMLNNKDLVEIVEEEVELPFEEEKMSDLNMQQDYSNDLKDKATIILQDISDTVVQEYNEKLKPILENDNKKQIAQDFMAQSVDLFKSTLEKLKDNGGS